MALLDDHQIPDGRDAPWRRCLPATAGSRWASCSVWMLTIAQFTRLVSMPLELETLRGLSALKVGIVLTPSALGIAATMPIGGRMADRVGVRLPVVIGLAGLAASFWPLAHLGLNTPLWLIGLWLFLGGLGAGLLMMPNTVAGMSSVPGRLVSQAASVRSLQRQIAGALGTAILAALLAAQIDPNHVTTVAARVHGQAAYNDLFLIAMFLLAGCFVVSLFLPDKARTLALQEERRRKASSSLRPRWRWNDCPSPRRSATRMTASARGKITRCSS